MNIKNTTKKKNKTYIKLLLVLFLFFPFSAFASDIYMGYLSSSFVSSQFSIPQQIIDSATTQGASVQNLGWYATNPKERTYTIKVKTNRGYVNKTVTEIYSPKNSWEMAQKNISETFDKIPEGSVVWWNLVGHGSENTISDMNYTVDGKIKEIGRKDYIDFIAEQAKTRGLHIVATQGDCYGAECLAYVKPEYLQDGLLTVLTASTDPKKTASAANAEKYLKKIIDNQEAIDTNKDGKVTYGEWQEWAKEKDPNSYIPSSMGNPDAVIFHKKEVTPYEDQVCVHIKPGQDDADGFGPMFGNMEVYDPDTGRNILDEYIKSDEGADEEGDGNHGGNYLARKNQMGHLREESLPVYEQISHQGDQDELRSGAGKSNYQTAKEAVASAQPPARPLYSSGGYGKPLSIQQLKESIGNTNHSYKAQGSDTAMPVGVYKIGQTFPRLGNKLTSTDEWVVAKQQGSEGCQFKILSEEEKKALFQPTQQIANKKPVVNPLPQMPAVPAFNDLSSAYASISSQLAVLIANIF
jgi:hypothetical protein